MNLPHSLEAEKAVLGSIILDQELIYEAVIKLSIKDFYSYFHKTIFENLLKLYKQNKAIDSVTLVESIAKDKKTSENEIMSQIKGILNSVVTSNHFDQYLLIIKEKAKLRDLAKMAKMVQDNINIQDYEEIRASVEKTLEHGEDVNEINSVLDLRDDILIRYDQVKNNNITDLKTGVKAIDDVLNGYSLGSLNTIAANTGMGKSTLALNIAENVARQNKRVMIFSLEMDNLDVVHKMISNKAKIQAWKMKRAFLGSKEYDMYVTQIEELANLDIAICDKGMMNIYKLISMVKAYNSKKKVDLIVVDYLQLIRSDNYKQNKSLQIGEVTQSLKALARELRTHVVLLSQFSRENTKQDRRPILADLKESSSIEQDSDTVTFIHYEKSTNEHEIIIAKNRHGETKSKPVIFDGEYSIFREA